MAVYFVECNGKVKIGYSENPINRVSGFQTGNPEEITLIGYIENFGRNEEKLLHSMFKDYHCRGEWFDYTPEVKKIIEEMTAPKEFYFSEEFYMKEFVVVKGFRLCHGLEFCRAFKEVVCLEDDYMLMPRLETIENIFRVCGCEEASDVKMFFIPPVFYQDNCPYYFLYYTQGRSQEQAYYLMEEKVYRMISNKSRLYVSGHFLVRCEGAGLNE